LGAKAPRDVAAVYDRRTWHESFVDAESPREEHDGFSHSRQKAQKAQRGKPQPKNLNRSKQRKQRRKNFARNAQLSDIALQSRQDGRDSLRLRAFASLR
jgi:hypothetical protein